MTPSGTVSAVLFIAPQEKYYCTAACEAL